MRNTNGQSTPSKRDAGRDESGAQLSFFQSPPDSVAAEPAMVQMTIWDILKGGEIEDSEFSPTGRKSALDDLFSRSAEYRRSPEYVELMQFMTRFTQYAPFNCFLLHMQNPKATFVATPSQWLRRFGRKVNPEAQPMVILAPLSPVFFVYDLVDTDGPPLPARLQNPFGVEGRLPQNVWDRTLENLRNEPIAVVDRDLSFIHAGTAMKWPPIGYYIVGDSSVAAAFTIEINKDLPLESRYATLAHELGHIYCGHLGEHKDGWWEDRSRTPHGAKEIEAESVSFLVCTRLGLETNSAKYLARFANSDIEVPPMSLQAVLDAVTHIENLGGVDFKPKKKRKKRRSSHKGG